ncbi:MAG: type IV pilin [Methanobacteriota archaeon]|nr:MAG: type IV pilin [Euryarchaeota archaeon]
MKVILREDEAAVSEVIGTILILAMTVVLFSSIIIWVSSIPVPTAQTRLDMESSMTPVYNAVGAEIAVNITIRHLGGERLQPLPTRIYVQSQRGNNPPTTDIVLLHPYNGALATPSGLLDGSDSNWDAGERWAYKSFTIKSSDAITVTVVDLTKSIVEWRSAINGATGARPPVFVEKWTDGVPSTSGTDPVNEHLGFALYAKVIDPDNDLNPNSVYATLSIWFGTGNACDQPQKMHDDGVGADRVASDGIFSYGATTCVNPPFPNLNWDGSIILLNATDMQGNAVTSRLVLTVEQPVGGGGTPPPTQWQYIGFVQVVPGGWWGTNLNNPYNTATTFSLQRVTKTQLVNTGGPLFHLKMSNHGNRTIFFDGYTAITFTRTTGGTAPPSVFIIQPKDPNKAANAATPGGTAAYPGTGAQTNFAFAVVVDINPSNPDGGGVPSELFLAAANPFASVSLPTLPALVSGNTNAGTYMVEIIVSGIAGPISMTYGQIITRWGATYNPYDHLNDADPTTRTQWYSQLIQFGLVTIY